MNKKELKKMEFEDALNELENIVNSLESRDTKLKDAIDYFEKGQILAELCSNKLKEAENKIREVRGEDLVEFNQEN